MTPEKKIKTEFRKNCKRLANEYSANISPIVRAYQTGDDLENIVPIYTAYQIKCAIATQNYRKSLASLGTPAKTTLQETLKI